MCSTSRFSSSSFTGRVPGLPYDPFCESSSYITSYLPSFFTDGRASRKDRFCALERDDIFVLPPLLGLHSWYGCLSEGVAYKRATAACRFEGGFTTNARTHLSRDLTPVTEATFDRVYAKVGTEDDTVATAAAQGVIEASKARQRSQSDRALLPDLGSKAGTAAPGPDGLRFAHLQSVLATAVNKAKVSEVIQLFEGVF